MAKPIRIGIIGCGDVMTAYMAGIQHLLSGEQAQVFAACDTRQERLDYVGQRYGTRRLTQDYTALLNDQDVDLVLVLTTMPTHGTIARAALEAGKHVLVEKPMALTLAEAAGLVSLARERAPYLVCAPFVILSPTFRVLWHRLRRGDIGPVKSARARYGHHGPTWGQWYYRPGGGAIFDLMPYNLTSLTGLLGPVRRVAAFAGTATTQRLVDDQPMHVEVEDNAQVLLDFGDNLFAVATSGYTIQQYRSPAIELYGLDGAVQMLGDDWDPDGYEMWLNDVGAWLVFKESNPAWLWTDGLRHLIECIRDDTPPVVTPEHAYHVLEIMLAAKEAAQDGTTKRVLSDFPPLVLPAPPDLEPAYLIHDRTHSR